MSQTQPDAQGVNSKDLLDRPASSEREAYLYREQHKIYQEALKKIILSDYGTHGLQEIARQAWNKAADLAKAV